MHAPSSAARCRPHKPASETLCGRCSFEQKRGVPRKGRTAPHRTISAEERGRPGCDEANEASLPPHFLASSLPLSLSLTPRFPTHSRVHRRQPTIRLLPLQLSPTLTPLSLPPLPPPMLLAPPLALLRKAGQVAVVVVVVVALVVLVMDSPPPVLLLVLLPPSPPPPSTPHIEGTRAVALGCTRFAGERASRQRKTAGTTPSTSTGSSPPSACPRESPRAGSGGRKRRGETSAKGGRGGEERGGGGRRRGEEEEGGGEGGRSSRRKGRCGIAVA